MIVLLLLLILLFLVFKSLTGVVLYVAGGVIGLVIVLVAFAIKKRRS